ncbi:hypothetical protein CspHIS471_0101860 [Cutaneotrichosporon sp. HIS471]|nr:hypothetical protein CspHIS471_0101860 [Cutaneotrichosporon sp. HIS471]
MVCTPAPVICQTIPITYVASQYPVTVAPVAPVAPVMPVATITSIPAHSAQPWMYAPMPVRTEIDPCDTLGEAWLRSRRSSHSKSKKKNMKSKKKRHSGKHSSRSSSSSSSG